MSFSNFHIKRLSVVYVLLILFYNSALFSQSAITSAGGDFKLDKSSFSYSVGQILTSQDLSKSTSLFGENVILSHGVQQVFVQTCDESTRVEIIATPNPTSGFLLFLPKKDLIYMKMKVEDAVKMVISGGIVTPRIGKK